MNEHKTADDVVRLANAHAKLVNDALNDMRQERDEAKASLHNVCKDRDFVMEQLSMTRNERDALRQENKSFAAADQVAKAKLVDLRSKLSHQCDENEAVRKTLLAISQERTSLRNERLDLETTSLRNEKLDLETTVHALRKLNSSQTDTILKLQTQHENQRATILELQRAAGIRAKPSQQEYLRHELMDRASIMSNIFEAMIIDHPAIDPDEDCFSPAVHNTLSDKINAAADALNNVYQFIGDEHL